MYYYIRVAEQDYIVVVDRPNGQLELEGTYAQRVTAAERVHYLNGGITNGQLTYLIDQIGGIIFDNTQGIMSALERLKTDHEKKEVE